MSSANIRTLVIEFFEGSINRHDWSAVERTVATDVYLDHDGPGGPGGIDEARERYDAMFGRFPDFLVDLQDVLVEGDKVVVRGVWSGTDSVSGKRMGFKAFVQLRVANGRIVERWGVATPLKEMAPGEGW